MSLEETYDPATLEAQFCLSFNESGSFSPLCSLYSVPLSLSSALSGPLVYTGSGKRLRIGGFFSGSPLGEEVEGESPRGGERQPA